MRKWKYFCPKRYYGHYVRVLVTWGSIFAGSLWYRFLNPAFSIWLKRWSPPDFPLPFALQPRVPHSFSVGHACKCCPPSWVPSVCWLLTTSQLLLWPQTHLRIGKLSPASLPWCLPPCMTWLDSWVCSPCWLVCLLTVGQALLFTIRTRKESMEANPSHRTHLRLGQSQDCCQRRCWLRFSYPFEPFLYERHGNARGCFLQVKRWQQMWKHLLIMMEIGVLFSFWLNNI